MTAITADYIRRIPNLIPGDSVQKITDNPTTGDIHVIEAVEYRTRNGWTIPVYTIRRARDGRTFKRTYSRPELRVVGILVEENGSQIAR